MTFLSDTVKHRKTISNYDEKDANGTVLGAPDNDVADIPVQEVQEQTPSVSNYTSEEPSDTQSEISQDSQKVTKVNSECATPQSQKGIRVDIECGTFSIHYTTTKLPDTPVVYFLFGTITRAILVDPKRSFRHALNVLKRQNSLITLTCTNTIIGI
ncbi:hypothetical protein EMCRGX_G034426 [Ephydatia muelleri]